jgi:putative pyruvate formate lyase activating enzyme
LTALRRAPRASYLRLTRSGELEERARTLDLELANCALCPHGCRVDRRSELGKCATGASAVLASWCPHHGEEPVISGRMGSGTVFLANCNLACAFCQNYDISQSPRDFLDATITDARLASIFLDLQDRGCHNINWVSPSHQVPQLVRALALAVPRGLTVPIVYNTNAYDSVTTLELLEGIVDVWMPDLKFADPDTGCRLSGIPDYPQRARAAIAEMFRQTGDAWDLGPDGTLNRGILIRMLVLPDNLAGIEANLEWIATGLSPTIAISLLAQYRPANRVVLSDDFLDLRRGIEAAEWRRAAEALKRHMKGDRHHLQWGA